MSNKKLPDYRFKQKILYIDKTSSADLIHYGNLFFEAGRIPMHSIFFKNQTIMKVFKRLKILLWRAET